jgi:uncharacterized protein YbaP (TraB family)
MFRLPFAWCLVALCAITTCTYSQQPFPKSLLWRITGKGLKQPSYLYGTMHLTDNRLFQFGDSVYQAIERTAGLAIEVNPDEMGAYYVNKMFDEMEGTRLQNILNEKDYKKYSAALAKKFKKPASDITTHDILAEKNKWLNDYLEKGEMSTFVDAYLYNIARRQGKWVGGVEDITDQAGLLDELVDKSDIDFLLAGDSSYMKTTSNRMMEHMVELYTNQDLTGIESMSSGESPEYKDALLIRRNIKMARRIDSLTTLRTMFIAIGAAHLPGDSGVIHMLQQKGFTVEPVYSSKKIDSKNYVFKEVRLPWTETADPQGLYKISMPGNPVNLKLYGLIEMKYLFDVFSLSNYCTMAVVNPRGTTNKDSMLNELAQRMFHSSKKLTPKKVVNNGIEGREYQQVIKGENVRMQAFVYDNVVYLAFIYAIKEAVLTSEDANTFFSSFNISKTPLPVTGSYTFADSVMGISFISPTEVTYNKKMSSDKDEGWHVSAFTGTDISNGMYIMVFSKDVQPAHYLTSDSVIQNGLVNGIKNQYADLQVDTIMLQGYKGIHLQGAHSDQPGLSMEAVSLIKNNRNIVLLVISDSIHIKAPITRNIFSTLRFIPPAVMPWRQHVSPDSALSARLPGPFRVFDNGERRFLYAFDTTTASSYYIISDTLSKYTWYKQDSLFWRETVKRYTRDDSLINEKDIHFNGQSAREILIQENIIYKRMRLLQQDGVVYEVMVSGDTGFVYNDDATAFLNSFSLRAPVKHPDFLTQSKATLLLQDLTSNDSMTRRQAYHKLDDVSFNREDLPQLRQALFKQYLSPYFNQLKDDINLRLADVLGKLMDTATIAFIKGNYPLLTGEEESFRETALATLAAGKTKESYAALAQLIDEYGAPAAGIGYKCLSVLKDSLALTVPVFPVFLKLANDTAQSPIVANLALALKDSNLLKQEQLVPVQPDFIKAAKQLFPSYKNEKYKSYIIDDLLKLIGSFNTPAGNATLTTYLSCKDLNIRKIAAVQLAINKQTVPADVWLKIAADRSMRVQLYNELKDLKKSALFPKQYATQQYFAESAINEIASDDYNVQKMTFLSKRTATLKGKTYTFYLYHVVMEDDDPAGYLGIAGGYKPGSTSLELAEDINGLYWDETFKANRINVFFKAFLKSMEKTDETD